jgi:hypothetical protein
MGSSLGPGGLEVLVSLQRRINKMLRDISSVLDEMICDEITYLSLAGFSSIDMELRMLSGNTSMRGLAPLEPVEEWSVLVRGKLVGAICQAYISPDGKSIAFRRYQL